LWIVARWDGFRGTDGSSDGQQRPAFGPGGDCFEAVARSVRQGAKRSRLWTQYFAAFLAKVGYLLRGF